MSTEALLIFAKNPEAGKVKTRLAATIGNEAALNVYKQLLSHTASLATPLPMDKWVFYSDYVEQEDIWPAQHFLKQQQQGNSLGERMKNAFAYGFKRGYQQMVIIGTDCPGLNGEIIAGAFAALDSRDVVIGPAEDGGYYLLGMKKLISELFEHIPWSTSKVLNETINKCTALALSFHLLPALKDIDEEKDLKFMQHVQHHHPNF